MSNDNTSIYEFDLNLICEYFSALQRQGPGSPEVTLKALSFIENLNEGSQIVDLGCGTGGQTLLLAQHTAGQISGLDIFQRFIDIFNANAAKLSLQHRVKGLVGSMDDLPFKKGGLDLIWSEGAIYNIGFERGLKEWREYLKEGGYVAVTEASWFTDERPEEIEKFWMDAYPGIDTIPNKVDQMQKAAYLPVASFVLPDNCWTEHFFEPQAAAEKIFLNNNKGNKAAEGFVEYMRHEKQLYDKYKEFYGYVFYIGRKVSV